MTAQPLTSAKVGTTRSPTYKPVGALVAGLSILRHLTRVRSPMPLSRIAKELKINPSTCLSLLRTLVQEDLVVFDPQTKLYSMGLGILELMGGALANGADLRAIRLHTDAIALEEQVTVTVWRRFSSTRMVLVMESLPNENTHIKMTVGQRLPSLLGAAGRVLTAFADRAEREIREQYRTLRQDRAVPFEQFMKEVRMTRERGWAVDPGSFTTGVSSIGVPVFDPSGEATFAIVATMFAARYSDEKAKQLALALKRPADLITQVLPYADWAGV